MTAEETHLNDHLEADGFKVTETDLGEWIIQLGVCSMLGAMIGGWVADRYGFGMLYAAGAATILMTLGLQWAIHSRHPRI